MPFTSTLSNIFPSLVYLIPSQLILLSASLLDFLHVVVTAFCNTRRYSSFSSRYIVDVLSAKVNLSLKNIPTSNERTYKLQLIEKIKLFINKLRWKDIFFINNSKETTESCASGSAYGLKSNKCSRQLKELIPFENDLIDLVKNIKFRKVRNDFQMKLHEDLRKVRSSKKTLTFADKT